MSRNSRTAAHLWVLCICAILALLVYEEVAPASDIDHLTPSEVKLRATMAFAVYGPPALFAIVAGWAMVGFVAALTDKDVPN